MRASNGREEGMLERDSVYRGNGGCKGKGCKGNEAYLEWVSL